APPKVARAARGMARRMDRQHFLARPEMQLVAVRELHVGRRNPAHEWRHGPRTGRLANAPRRSDVVGVRMRFDHIAQRESEPSQQRDVALEALLDAVDEDGLPCRTIDDHVGERRRFRVEQLVQLVIHPAPPDRLRYAYAKPDSAAL